MFSTPRLEFSIITANDVQDVFETINSEQTAKMVSFFNWPVTIEQAEFWCEKSKQGLENKTDYLFIARKDTQPVGCIGIHPDAYKPALAETGYWVSESQQGQGFATEMLKGTIRFALSELGVKELFATASTVNDGSENVLIKNGFKHTGVKDVIASNGEVRPSNIYTLKL